MEVWITKYALGDGIYSGEAKICHSRPSMIEVDGKYAPQYFHGKGKDWHLTLESALKKAEKMRTEKIKSLKAQIAKLEKMEFTTKEK